MAEKSRLKEEALAKLGLKKLAELVMDAANHDAGFRRRVAAALAASKGPDAVAAVIDRRLAALARARGFVDWEESRTFAKDLGATVRTIVEELGKADPDAAIDRLIRFLATSERVFERIDDSNGHIQGIYYDAADAVARLLPELTPKQKAGLPDRLHRLVVDGEYGFTSQLFEQALPLLPDAAVAAWDARIAAEAASLPSTRKGDEDWERKVKLGQLVRLRQAVADRRGDCDAFIALELTRGAQPDSLAIAERLLRAGRHAEALEWVRKPSRPRVRFVTWQDGMGLIDASSSAAGEPVALELRILDGMGRSKEAQDLRWKSFLETLDGRFLREFVRRLPDFEEFDVLDRAFAHAAAAKDNYRALEFFLSWPRLDLASRLITDNLKDWDGRHYWILAPAADALEPDHPVAATILYRALLDRILAAARSKAYAHGARYLAELDRMAERNAGDGMIASHAAYRAGLLKKHGRKSGFWSLVKSGR